MKNYLFSTFKINMKKIINLKIIKAYNFEYFFCSTKILKIKKIIKYKKKTQLSRSITPTFFIC